MQHFPTTKNGLLSKKQIEAFGGAFSSKGKLLLKGTGSTKLVYIGGVDIFDSVCRETEGEMAFVNFELLKNGLVLRLNINQRQVCAGVKLDEIRSIKIQQIRTTSDINSNEIQSRLLLLLKDGSFSEFSIPSRFEKSIISFFKKPVFKDFFHLSLKI
jgi:hypothetical protein